MTVAKRSSELTSRIMKSIRGTDSKAEVVLRKALFARGVRYRKHYPIAGTPDVVIVGAGVAIFVDGDFWHGNSWKRRGLSSLEAQFPSRTDYWVAKIRRNIARDKKMNRQLRKEGWIVMRFWESDILADVQKCVDKVMDQLSSSK